MAARVSDGGDGEAKTIKEQLIEGAWGGIEEECDWRERGSKGPSKRVISARLAQITHGSKQSKPLSIWPGPNHRDAAPAHACHRRSARSVELERLPRGETTSEAPRCRLPLGGERAAPLRGASLHFDFFPSHHHHRPTGI